MPITKITKVGAFTDDVAQQINANFAQIAGSLMLRGIDVNGPAVNPLSAPTEATPPPAETTPKNEKKSSSHDHHK